MNYHKKYLKYRNKYIDLKNQKGGNSELFQYIKDYNIKNATKIIETLPDLNIKDERGIPILILAIIHGSYKIAELLVEKGADINIIDDLQRRTPLMHSLSDGVKSFSKCLIKNGADINFENDKKESAFFFSVVNELYDITKLLLDKNVKINPKYDHRFSPLYYLIDQKQELLAISLIEKGGLDIDDGIQTERVFEDALGNELPSLLIFLLSKNYDLDVAGKLYDDILRFAEYNRISQLIELVKQKINIGEINITYGTFKLKIRANDKFRVPELINYIAFRLDINPSSISIMTKFRGQTQVMDNKRNLADYGFGHVYKEMNIDVIPKMKSGLI
jgi:ankyrin repeat protein